jgi:hypothetical protein
MLHEVVLADVVVASMKAEDVFKQFAHEAARYHVAPRPAHPTSAAPLRRWLDETRALTESMPFDDTTKAALRQSVERVATWLDWPARYFTTFPRSVLSEPTLAWRVSLHLWAADRLLRAINDVETAFAAERPQSFLQRYGVMQIPPTKFWPALFDWLPTERYGELPFVDYLAAQKRVKGFAQTIRVDAHDALMVELIRSAFQGPFGPRRQP